jgi:hypothetical protein
MGHGNLPFVTGDKTCFPVFIPQTSITSSCLPGAIAAFEVRHETSVIDLWQAASKQ